MAKIVLSDQNMGDFAAKEFRQIVADLNEECLLKTGTNITDLVEKSNMKREKYEVETKDAALNYPPPNKGPSFDKNLIKIRPAHDALAIQRKVNAGRDKVISQEVRSRSVM